MPQDVPKPGRPPQGGNRDNDGRRHKRFSVEVEAVVRDGAGRIVRARTRDVSQTGICLISTDPVTTSDLLQVELVLSFGDDAYSEPLNLASRVVWCTRIGTSYQVGAMFESVTDEQDNFLEMFLQFLDGTLAPKGVEGYPEPAEDDGPQSAEDKDNPFKS